MKKKNLKSLLLNKKSVSNLNQSLIMGGRGSGLPTSDTINYVTCMSCYKKCGDWDREN